MSYVYLGQPYTHINPDIQSGRYHRALSFVAENTKLNSPTIYSPIIHFHNISLFYKLPHAADWWWPQNLAMLQHASELWILQLPGWEDSKGLEKEIQWAQDHDMPIEYYLPY